MNFEERLVGRFVRTDIRLATEELTNQVSQRRVQLGLLSVATNRTRRERPPMSRSSGGADVLAE